MLSNSNSKRNAALMTGTSIIIMAVSAGFGTFFLEKSISGGIESINSAALLIGTIAWIIILITDLLVSWGLYIIFKSKNQNLALFTMVWRIIYSMILAVAISFLIGALIDQGNYVDVQIEKFQKLWSLGLITFGIHLAGLYVLSMRYFNIPKLIAIFIGLSAFGYVLIHGGDAIFENFQNVKKITEYILFIPMVFGELGLAIWLLIKRNKLT